MGLKTLQKLLIVIVGCFVVGTLTLAGVIAARQAALQRVSRYNVTWTVSQTVSEFLRLETEVAAFAAGGSNASLDEVQLRLDIMFSRIATFEEREGAEAQGQRSLRRFIATSPRNERIVADTRRAIEAIDRLLAQGGGQAFDAAAALDILQPLEPQLTELASAAASFGAGLADRDQRELQTLHLIFSGLAAGLVLCGVSLIVLLRYNNRLLAQAHDSLSTITSELRDTSHELRLQNGRFDAALNNMSQALCTFDGVGRLAVFNERFAALTGGPEQLRVGMTLSELLAGSERTGGGFAALFAAGADLVQRGGKASFVHDLEDGRSFAASHLPLPEGGWLATYEDVTAPRRAYARIAHMAHHDALTDLPNRVLFREQLEQCLAESCQTGKQIHVLLIDLDGFKDVNDALGHQIGDMLLQGVAGRLRGFAGRLETVARLGGDEFAAIVARNENQSDSLECAESVVEALSAPYAIASHEVAISASIGVACSSASELRRAGELMRHADLALYQAKSEGKRRVKLFRPELEAQFQARKALEADLRKCLQNGELQVHYQPILASKTREVCGYEALLRWQHPTRGMIPPSEFIPVAEDMGLIASLGEWVLRQACHEAARWTERYTVAVNLSPIQFRSQTLVQSVVSALAAAGLAAHRLEMEITESLLLHADDKTMSTLLRLKDLGVRIAMDDFGTGYSSLSNLHSFPFDKIKIDQSFVRELTARADARAVVQLIIDLGKRLGMDTTAEGVETEEQFVALREMGCTQVQGFLFARPMPAGQLRNAARQAAAEQADRAKEERRRARLA